MVKVYHRPADAKVLHDYPLLASSSGDNNRVAFLSERSYNIILNCIELTGKLRKRVISSSDGPLYEIVNDSEWANFQLWVQDLENELGGWQLSNELLERIAIALESLDAKTDDVMTVEGMLNKIEDLYGVGTLLNSAGQAVLGLFPSLSFKVRPLDVYMAISDYIFKANLLFALGALTAAVGTVTTAIAAHLPIAAASALIDRITGIGGLLLDLQTLFYNWYTNGNIGWGNFLSTIWSWIIGSDPENDPDPNDAQIRQAVALEAIVPAISGLCTCLKPNSNNTNGGIDDMSTTVNVYNGCCPTCGGQTGSTGGSEGDTPPTQPYPEMPPWIPQTSPDIGVFPASFGSQSSWLEYRCKVAHAIFLLMLETTSTFSVSNMTAWLATAWTQGWQAAVNNLQTTITGGLLGTILLPGNLIGGLAIGILGVLRFYATLIYTLASSNAAGLAIFLNDHKEEIICDLLSIGGNTNEVLNIYADQLESYGMDEETKQFYGNVSRWLIPPIVQSALVRDARGELDLSSIVIDPALCACDPHAEGAFTGANYTLCNPFTGETGGGVSGPKPSGMGQEGWTSNEGATFFIEEGLAKLNYPSATVVGVNGLESFLSTPVLVNTTDPIQFYCQAISLGFNDFRCEAHEENGEWLEVGENIHVIQSSGAYINFTVPAPLDGLYIDGVRLLVRGQNFCHIGHINIGDTPCP